MTPKTSKVLRAHFRRLVGDFRLKQGNILGALESYNKALKTLPADHRIHLGMATAHRELGQIKEARMRLETAARIPPANARVNDALARVLLAENDTAGAERHAWRALSLDPDLEQPLLPELVRRRPDGEKLAALHDRLLGLSARSTQAYGRYGLYQGLETLLLPGQRPAERRLASYDLDGLLNKGMSALDVGCNCGFLSLCLAPKVSQMLGVELDERMVEVATVTSQYLGLSNVRFEQGRFEEFAGKARQQSLRFDLVVATAVHMHVSYTIDEFGDVIADLLAPGGVVLLESQDLRTTDWNFGDKVDRFRRAGRGYDVVSQGETIDENAIPRSHVVLRLRS